MALAPDTQRTCPAPDKCALPVSNAEIGVIDLIGVGTFGEVYRAQWRARVVAVKVLRVERGRRPGAAEDDAYRRERFARELQLLTALRHPHIVQCLGGSVAGTSRPFIICEYMDGGTLKRWLRATRPAPTRDLQVALHTARALAFLHSLSPPIVHRDVKSDNYLVNGGAGAMPVVKLSDFGLSRVLASFGEKMTPCGSVAYSAPEVIRCEAYSERADVYGYGVVLWEVVTHATEPYAGLTPLQVQIGVSLRGMRPPLPPAPSADPRLVRILSACWREVPAQRPCMQQIVAVLERIRESMGRRR